MNLTDGLHRALALDTALLPAPWLMRVWLSLGWALVSAALGMALAARWTERAWLRWSVAGALALWACLPAPYASAYWLGLAFQAPSVVTGLCCALLLYTRLRPPAGERTAPVLAPRKAQPAKAPKAQLTKAPARAHATTRRHDDEDVPAPTPAAAPPGARHGDWILALLGVLLGWVLLLDTLALLPLQVYAWGFSAAAVALALVVAALPWVFSRPDAAAQPWLAVVPLALLLFVATHLPSGNVWDVLLDPWLWVALHVYLVRRLSRRFFAVR